MTRIYTPPYTDDVEVTVHITCNSIEFVATSTKDGFGTCQCSKRLCTVNGLVSLDDICAAEKEAIETVLEDVQRAEAISLVNSIRMKKALDEFSLKHSGKRLSEDNGNEIVINDTAYNLSYKFDVATNLCSVELRSKAKIPYFASDEPFINQIINKLNAEEPVLLYKDSGDIIAKAVLYMNYDLAYVSYMIYRMDKILTDFEAEYTTDDY